jgi:hypothetical protein
VGLELENRVEALLVASLSLLGANALPVRRSEESQ